jgi:molybdenum cofactor cytidylyltransferase
MNCIFLIVPVVVPLRLDLPACMIDAMSAKSESEFPACHAPGGEAESAAFRAPGGKAARIAGLLLAGGRGSRFDPSGRADKLLAPWHGRPIASHAAQLLASACAPCFAILPPEKPALRELLESMGLQTVVDDKVREGMGVSLATGVRAILAFCQPDAIVVALADMPAIRCATLSTVLAAWRLDAGHHLAAAPFYKGKRGHPVVFDARLFPKITALTGDRGAASLLGAVPILVIDIDDPGVLQDVDTEADLSTLDHSPNQTS